MRTPSDGALRDEVAAANHRLAASGLVTLEFGNASGIDRPHRAIIIKPSGIACGDVTAEELVRVDLESGESAPGSLRPSSDTPTHLALYRRYPEIGGIVHTHSLAASSWAQAMRPIPPYGTTHADHFGGPVPVTRPLSTAEIGGDYERETGVVIIETLETANLDPLVMPAVLVASHGPFSWGADAMAAVTNAIALEAVAAMAINSVLLRPDVRALQSELLDRHFGRKHGPSAYYGQRSGR
jgi:L-ribulose-5-phosphate 4-epimerase